MDTFFSLATPPTIFLAFSLLLCSLLLIFKHKHIHSSKELPQAGGAMPLIGHLHLLTGPDPPHIALGKMADKYGPIFGIRLGVHRAMVVSNSETAKECLTTNDNIFCSRPKSLAGEILGYNYAIVTFSPYGTYWRQIRKTSILEILSNRRIELLKHVRESEVKASLKEVYENCMKNNGFKVAVDMKRWFGDLTLNVLLRMVVGKKLEEIGDAGESRRAMRELLELAGAFTLADAVPFLRWLDIGGYEKRMNGVAKELDEVLEGWLKEHKTERNLRQESGDDRDFMSTMLSVLGDSEDLPSYHADIINKATCLTMILAGTDTTTATMTWALALLLNNRHVLQKAQHELDTHIGRKRQVTESDTKNLVYLEAIVKETLRLYPVLPLSIPHESMTDCTVGGYHVAAGTRLVLNISKLQRDSKVWIDPNKFEPERFLTSHKNVDVKGQSFELLPFSSGRRGCPGISLALQVIQLTLATLLHGFEFTTLNDEAVDMTESMGISNLKVTPLDVLLAPRLPAQLYG